MTATTSSVYLRRHIALPQDHGSWVFILSPLLIGIAAGGTFSWASLVLMIAVMAAFLARQPLTAIVKIYSGRRNRRDLPAAIFWAGFYGLIGLFSVAVLIQMGFGFVLYLAIPGIPVFIWHLILVSRRAERRQMGVEVVASGVLALAAPAAFWVGVGSPDPLGWWLFILMWLQSAASIVHAYLRLDQRMLTEMPSLAARFQLGSRALMYTSFNLVFVSIFALLGDLPALLSIPYAVQWGETLWGVINPAIGYKPTRIGVRQLAVSSLFTILFIIAWLLW